jgi:hypothetical protein
MPNLDRKEGGFIISLIQQKSGLEIQLEDLGWQGKEEEATGTPEQWFMFDSPFYVPFPEYEGIRDQKMGSLLALPSDQNISVTLKWYPQEEKKERFIREMESMR